MAAHKPFSPAKLEEMRARIRATLLLKKLEDHVLGEVEMTKTQLTAANILLRKCMPDLAMVQHTGDAESPIRHVIAWDSGQWNGPSES